MNAKYLVASMGALLLLAAGSAVADPIVNPKITLPVNEAQAIAAAAQGVADQTAVGAFAADVPVQVTGAVTDATSGIAGLPGQNDPPQDPFVLVPLARVDAIRGDAEALALAEIGDVNAAGLTVSTTAIGVASTKVGEAASVPSNALLLAGNVVTSAGAVAKSAQLASCNQVGAIPGLAPTAPAVCAAGSIGNNVVTLVTTQGGLKDQAADAATGLAGEAASTATGAAGTVATALGVQAPEMPGPLPDPAGIIGGLLPS